MQVLLLRCRLCVHGFRFASCRVPRCLAPALIQARCALIISRVAGWSSIMPSDRMLVPCSRFLNNSASRHRLQNGQCHTIGPCISRTGSATPLLTTGGSFAAAQRPARHHVDSASSAAGMQLGSPCNLEGPRGLLRTDTNTRLIFIARFCSTAVSSAMQLFSRHVRQASVQHPGTPAPGSSMCALLAAPAGTRTQKYMRQASVQNPGTPATTAAACAPCWHIRGCG
ncbi:hypothetical protein COO60DRAFT_1523927 [Scenedesmus sp. NREL 46B-D3]|nr:hypothetical protein COO60DRAFT_1523927 [Scenedesmus sp. NREL 46B-D3]